MSQMIKLVSQSDKPEWTNTFLDPIFISPDSKISLDSLVLDFTDYQYLVDDTNDEFTIQGSNTNDELVVQIPHGAYDHQSFGDVVKNAIYSTIRNRVDAVGAGGSVNSYVGLGVNVWDTVNDDEAAVNDRTNISFQRSKVRGANPYTKIMESNTIYSGGTPTFTPDAAGTITVANPTTTVSFIACKHTICRSTVAFEHTIVANNTNRRNVVCLIPDWYFEMWSDVEITELLRIVPFYLSIIGNTVDVMIAGVQVAQYILPDAALPYTLSYYSRLAGGDPAVVIKQGANPRVIIHQDNNLAIPDDVTYHIAYMLENATPAGTVASIYNPKVYINPFSVIVDDYLSSELGATKGRCIEILRPLRRRYKYLDFDDDYVPEIDDSDTGDQTVNQGQFTIRFRKKTGVLMGYQKLMYQSDANVDSWECISERDPANNLPVSIDVCLLFRDIQSFDSISHRNEAILDTIPSSFLINSEPNNYNHLAYTAHYQKKVTINKTNNKLNMNSFTIRLLDSFTGKLIDTRSKSLVTLRIEEK